MKEIIFLYYPCMVVVCDKNEKDPETNDLREYARIHLETTSHFGYPVMKWDFAGDIIWNESSKTLSDEDRASIEAEAASIADKDREKIEWAKAFQARQIAQYGE